MQVKTWTLFHSTEGMLGSWEESVDDHNQATYSIAYGCPICGDLWLRKLARMENRKNLWVFFTEVCNKCPGIDIDGIGSLFFRGNLLQEFSAGTLPMNALRYEFLLEYNKWQNKNKSKASSSIV